MPLQPLEQVVELWNDGELEQALVALDGILRAEPDAARLHALRAFILLSSGRSTEAATAVARALALDANDGYVQHAAAEVALARGEPAEAITAARRAQALDRDDDEAIIIEARARAMLGQWGAVIARCDYVLSGNPENEDAALIRALAIENKEKGALLGAADWKDLARRFPANSFMRTGYAWTLLTSARSSAAREQFEQALVLDPGSTWAKQGLVLSLKAKYPGYGLLLRYAFWMLTLTPRTRWMVSIGGIIGYNFVRRMAAANPEMRPFLMPLLVAYLLFLVATWIGDPLLSLLLMAKAEARRVLSKEDKSAGQLVGAGLLAAVLLAVGNAAGGWEMGYLPAMAMVASTLTVGGAFQVADKHRTRLLFLAATFAGASVLSVVVGRPNGTWLTLYALLGAAACTWLARLWMERELKG